MFWLEVCFDEDIVGQESKPTSSCHKSTVVAMQIYIHRALVMDDANLKIVESNPHAVAIVDMV